MKFGAAVLVAGAIVALVVITSSSSPQSARSVQKLWWKDVGIVDYKPHHKMAPSRFARQEPRSDLLKVEVSVPNAEIQSDGVNIAEKAPSVEQRTEAPYSEKIDPMPTQQETPIPDHLLKQAIKVGKATVIPGVHFFADYNVSAVKNEPFVTENPMFQYIPDDSPFPHIWLSMKPRIALIPDFLTHEECDAIIAAAKPKLSRSLVARYKQEEGKTNVDEARTSRQAWLNPDEGPMKPVADRIAQLTGWTNRFWEPMQVLNYDVGQKYNSHHDYFDPALYGPQESNRAVTVYMYFSDVEEGGETVFPRADGKPPVYDYVKCSQGLAVRPKKGWVAVFYDMKPNGEFDEYSLHGACPVKKGMKWGATLWHRLKTPPRARN